MPHSVVFPPDLQARIREAQAKLREVLPFVDQVEECGVRCQEQRKLLDTLSQTLAMIESKFMDPPSGKV